MKAEEVEKIADQALKQLAETLKQGKSDAIVRYLTMLAKFHHYSFGNVMMILFQKPDASRVAGFNTWKQLGRFVKKGEKGIVIIAPMTICPKEDEIQDGKEQSNRNSILRFRAVYVFDVLQTEGQDLPEPARVTGNPLHHLTMLRELVAQRDIELTYEILPSGIDGVSRGGSIGIRSGMEQAHEFSVIVHEFAHELLHRDDQRPSSKTVRETEAEAVAYVVCQAIGLDTGSASSDYIQLYNGQIETLAASLHRIQFVAAEIIAALQGAETGI